MVRGGGGDVDHPQVEALGRGGGVGDEGDVFGVRCPDGVDGLELGGQAGDGPGRGGVDGLELERDVVALDAGAVGGRVEADAGEAVARGWARSAMVGKVAGCSISSILRSGERLATGVGGASSRASMGAGGFW